MITKSDWQDANRELIAEARENLDAPTGEEMLAYSLGKLSEADQERVREWLVANPDLARMYGEPFPDEPQPGDPDYASAEKVERGWVALQERMERTSPEPAQRGRVLFLRFFPTSVAAALALVFGALYWQAEIRIAELNRQVSRPLALGEKTQLFPDGRRGLGGPTPLSKEGDAYHLVITLINQPYFDHYRINLIGSSGQLPVWSTTGVRRENDSFDLVVPHAAIPPGAYQLIVYGLDGKGETQLGAYNIRVD